MKNPKISIVIPVYNAEKYLRGCLDSAANQTLREIEIICVDDGSKDSSGAILDEYAAKDERFVVVHQSNAGVAVTRNNALRLAKGEYLAFLDSDDQYQPTLCEDAYERAVQSGADIVKFFYTAVGTLNEPADLVDNTMETDVIGRLKLVFHGGANVWGKLWKRDFIAHHQIVFPCGVDSVEDMVFNVHGAIFAKGVCVLKKRLYRYYFHEGSLTTEKNYINSLRGIAATQMAVSLIPKDDPSGEEIKKFLYSYQLRNLYRVAQRGGQMRRQVCAAVKKNLNKEAKRFLMSNSLDVSRDVRLFFILVFGNVFQRFAAWLKILKGRVADWLAKKLVPHSDWLQGILQREQEQRTRIEQFEKEGTP